MCKPHFLALFWADTKIVNYFSNCCRPTDVAPQFKRPEGGTTKKVRFIPGTSKICHPIHLKTIRGC
jgi:hypothetical protein